MKNLRNVKKFYSISVGGDRSLRKIKAFVPEWNLVKDFKDGKISWREYEAFFYMMLKDNMKGKEEVIKKWCKDNDRVCLLCFEKDDKFCHRRIVREYLMSLGVECVEA